jgi:uncharacterized protein (DUF433 family)
VQAVIAWHWRRRRLSAGVSHTKDDDGGILDASQVEVPMAAKNPVVHSDPNILSGTPVFVGTRVPFQTLLDYLEAGDPLDEFLDDFPTVTREQAVAALEQAKEALLAHACPPR